MRGYFVTGIGTEIGKTVASAVLVKALDAAYWKPVQAGELDNTDTMKVRSLTNCEAYPERYRLKHAMSPHAAASREKIDIHLEDFTLPDDPDRLLIVEGAGGLLVPINNQGNLIIDLIRHLELPAIVVSGYYLGSINHTLLSIEALKSRGIEIAGLMFNGKENSESREAILSASGARDLGRIEQTESVDAEFIDREAKKLTALHELKG